MDDKVVLVLCIRQATKLDNLFQTYIMWPVKWSLIQVQFKLIFNTCDTHLVYHKAMKTLAIFKSSSVKIKMVNHLKESHCKKLQYKLHILKRKSIAFMQPWSEFDSLNYFITNYIRPKLEKGKELKLWRAPFSKHKDQAAFPSTEAWHYHTAGSAHAIHEVAFLHGHTLWHTQWVLDTRLHHQLLTLHK